MNVKALSLRSLQVHLKVAIVALCMAAALFAMPHPAQADGLTEPQIQAVLGLLSAFDVPQATIDNVSNILHGTVTGSTNTNSSITVTSVTPTSNGNLVHMQSSNLEAGWSIRVIGVNGSAAALPVSSASLIPVSGGYSGNQVVSYTLPADGHNFPAVTVPYWAPAGSYVVEVSNPSKGWITVLRTPAFYIGSSATTVTTPSCTLSATRNASTGLVTFSWTTQNTSSFSLYPIAGGTHWVTPAASGSWTYGTSVNTTTTFTGTATDANAAYGTCSATVTVTAPITATTPSCTLSATRVAGNGNVTFNWTTHNATSFSIYPAPNSMFMSPVAQGSWNYGPVTASTTFTGTATDANAAYDTCTATVAAAASCTFNGQTVADGASVSAYQSSSVSAGQTCAWQTRVCSNGTLSGSYQSASCTPAAASSCSNGLSITQYPSCACPSGQVQTGSVCTSTAPLLSGVTNATTFWSALYACIQTRNATESEISYWVGQTGSGVTSLSAAYRSFFGSTEYLNKQTSNQTYLTQLYQCVLFRSPDSSGYAYWLTQLQGGTSRDAMLNNFFGGAEFQGTQGPALRTATGLSLTAAVSGSQTASVSNFDYLSAYSEAFNQNMAAVAVGIVDIPLSILTDALSDLFYYAGIY